MAKTKPTYSSHIMYGGQHYKADLFIDHEALVKVMARRSSDSANGKSTLAFGAVKLQLTRPDGG